jgi:HEAT repeat protein
LGQIAKYTASFKSQRVAQKLIDLPESWNVNDSTTAPYPITIAKLSILRHFKDYVGVREYVINSLDHQSSQVQIAAASTLLSWDEWELAAPVICRNEAYIEFQMHRDDRAIPLLEEATRNGGWQGRIFAAAALFYTYGDSARYPQVALDIILNAPININDENTNRAKFLALDQVARFNLTQALPGLIRMAQDTARGISAKAVSYLVDLAGMGHSEATQALLDIKENHPNANVRAIARHGLTKLEQEQK